MLPRLGAVAIADSSHFIDGREDELNAPTVEALRQRTRNLITLENLGGRDYRPEPPGTRCIAARGSAALRMLFVWCCGAR